MNDARLQELYQRALDARGERVRAGCPTPEMLRALVAREGAESTRLATLDHVMACRECQREFELLRAIAAAAPPAPRWRVSAPLALAASLLLVVAASVVGIRALSRPGDDVMRGGGAEGVSLITPASETPRVLRWHRVPGAISYRVEVLTDSGALLSGATTTDTSAAIPDSVPLPEGARYLWWVRAHRADGTELRSPMQPLR